MLLALLLQASTLSKYGPAPWYLRWLESMPAEVVIGLAVLAGLAWLLKVPIETFFSRLANNLADRMKASSKEPTPGSELARKAQKAVILEQKAENLRLRINCDHVSVYGCQNGEYLRSGDGVDKFVMQAEATPLAVGRYMDIERTMFASDVPRLVLSLEQQPYVLIWAGRHDDWKVNKMMSERGYTSAVACFIRRPIKPGSAELGVIGMFSVTWFTCEVYRPDQAAHLPAAHHGETRLLTVEMEQLLLHFAQEFSYSM